MKANATNGTSDARALGESEPEVHLRKRYASFGFVFCVALWSVTDTAYAKNCSSSGSLAYIGRTNDSSSSVWLSTIGEGASSSFRLEAAQGSTTVDAFGPTTPGDAFRHLSLSPFVSNGSGGTHKLYDSTSGDCLLDTQNQKGGIVFPPFPSRPPVGIRPPIAILPPPGGLMPTMPGRVSPTIGTLPPTGVMPTFPAGVRPPIAILPPTGVKPGLPGGVSPPIGTLPPGGLVPTLPGRVSPPIAILPPTGVKPGLPGGVSPPIGTLPPGGGSGGAGGGSGGGGSSGGGGAVAGQVTTTTNAGASPRQSLGGAASCTADQRRYPDLAYCDPDERYLGSAGGAPLTT